ncbi:MAG: hypothetical protein SVV80_08465 [Planctomycetota bacterium]|nr:hypothetical protein [Planctomycetota bacterium]
MLYVVGELGERPAGVVLNVKCQANDLVTVVVSADAATAEWLLCRNRQLQ